MRALIISTLISLLTICACNMRSDDVMLKEQKKHNEVVSNNYPIVSTGQTQLYDDNGNEVTGLNPDEPFYGQDGNYQKGHQMSYVDHNDGTVSDKATGLMWQAIPSHEDRSWDDAMDYCNNLVLAGYNDWRMPTVKELFTIQDFGRSWPYIDTAYFKLASGLISKDEQFWSSTKYVGVTATGRDNSAFGVNAVTGHIKSYSAASRMPKGDGESGMRPPPPPQNNDGAQPRRDTHPPKGNPLFKYVRAVRGASYGVNDFIDNNDNTISDRATGLMWAKVDNGKGIDWEASLKYAESSALAGYKDWRLPNVKELQSIVDYSYSSSATDLEIKKASISPLFNCTEITNEADTKDYGYYWTSTSAQFTKEKPYYYAWYVAFGQAVNPYGVDSHGAGAVRFDTKHENGIAGEGGERYYNFVRLVRMID